jgi:hypothetical protein
MSYTHAYSGNRTRSIPTSKEMPINYVKRIIKAKASMERDNQRLMRKSFGIVDKNY